MNRKKKSQENPLYLERDQVTTVTFLAGKISRKIKELEKLLQSRQLLNAEYSKTADRNLILAEVEPLDGEVFQDSMRWGRCLKLIRDGLICLYVFRSSNSLVVKRMDGIQPTLTLCGLNKVKDVFMNCVKKFDLRFWMLNCPYITVSRMHSQNVTQRLH